MKIIVKFLAALAVLIVILFAGLAFFVSHLDADKYRSQIIAAIAQQTGRAVKLNGPIAFSLGLNGGRISIQDAALANPAWASRPMLASMGRFEVNVSLLPLLKHRVVVNELVLENADILLETDKGGQRNWDFAKSAQAVPVPVADAAKPPAPSTKEAVTIDNLTIVNSQIAWRNGDGKMTTANVAALALDMSGAGAILKFKGDANNVPILLTLKTNIKDLLGEAPFTFNADATYQAIHLIAKGKADFGHNQAEISYYNLSAGQSALNGDLTVNWGEARPVLRGSLNGDIINPADFKANSVPGDDRPIAVAAPHDTGNKRMFSDTPLPLEGLKAVDADLSVSVDAFPLGRDALKQISAHLILSNGVLSLMPVKANVGASTIEFQLKLNAAQNPAQLMFGVVAKSVDLGDLQKLGGMTPFMTGKAGANIQLSGQGNSAHEIASSLGGVINITAEKGEIFTGAAAGISSALAAIFSTGSGDDALNCLAARFIAKNGILTDNGILIDSSASMVVGKGGVNLGSETVGLVLRAKTKLVDVGGLVPTLGIGGTLAKPDYNIDALGIIKNVVGTLLNGDVDIISSNVPDIQAAPAGQNACLYTLDHPQKAASGGILSPTGLGKVGQKIQTIGNSLLKGLFNQ